MADQILTRLATRPTNRQQRLVGQLLAVFSLCVSLLSLLLFSTPAQARPHHRHFPGIVIARENQAGISPAQAASIAENQYGGKVLKVTRQGDAYQIRLLLPSGTIKNVSIDANNGSIR